jgi:serine/threonine-protein kinase
LVQRADGSQRVKVLDFGISKSIGSATTEEMSLTKTSAWIGSPLYMAPEQMQSARDVDHRADIWSMGAILYELISGAPPYQAESLPQLCNLLITTDPEPIQNRVPSVPQGLADAVMGCLVRDRDARIQSAGELAVALAKHATSITGSGLRESLLDPSQAGVGAPASALAQSAAALSGYTPAEAAPSPASAMSEGVSANSDTQPPPPLAAETVTSSTNAAWGSTDDGDKPKSKVGLIVGGVAAAAILAFVLMSSGGETPAEETEPPVVASDAAPTEEPEPAVEEAPPVEEEPEPAPAPEPEPEAAPAPAPATAAPAPKPRPQVVQPKPKPKPKPADDFADFGGRR